MSAETILVAGTASHVGKSTVVTGLCKLLADRGIAVAPFKAQNMSNNAQVVPRPDDGTGGEIGVSQHVQANAAGVVPTTDHNPVLLKPHGNGESQVIVHGRPAGSLTAGEYFEDQWQECRDAALESHRRLRTEYEVIVAEGAGAIAEPNLVHRDLANIETARFADATIVLLADLERGGAFASVIGTIALVPHDVRERIHGVILTKFRGDRSLLDDGIETIEARTGIPVLGVVPYLDPGLPTEDSVSLPDPSDRAVIGPAGSEIDSSIRIGVPRLPRIANTTDLDPLARTPGVAVEIHPLSASIDRYDAIIIPGTKNTVDDLHALRAAGYVDRVRRFEGPIVGICGGYQMLGIELRNAHIEGTTEADAIDGIGVLPVVTRFDPEKQVRRVERPINGGGPLGSVTGRVRGYEIHHGVTEPVESVTQPFEGEGAIVDNVLGTALHGLFEHTAIRRGFLSVVAEQAGVEWRDSTDPVNEDPFETAVSMVRDWCDLDSVLPVSRR